MSWIPCMWWHKTWSFMSYSVNMMGCRLGMMSYVCQVWWLTHMLWYQHRVIRRYRCLCRLCDDTETVAVMSNMVGEMSGVFVVFSWNRYGDSVLIGYDVINIVGVKLYLEVCNVLKSCSDSMHTVYDVTCIVSDVIQRVGVVKLIPWVWWHSYSGCSVSYNGTDCRYNVRIAICVMSYIGCVMAWVQWM